MKARHHPFDFRGSVSGTAAGLVALLALAGARSTQFTVPDPLCLRSDGRVVPPDLTVDEGFGASVALSNDTLLVGAPGASPMGIQFAGTAYVFERDPLGAWIQQAELVPDVHLFQVGYGTTVALDGDVAVVGGDDQVMVFERSAGVWSAPVPLVGSDSVLGDMFGRGLAVDGERILVGAPGDGAHSGSVYVFERQGGTWTEITKLHPDDTEPAQQFGASVALSGDRALIGAWGADGTSLGQGAAYVFELDALEGWQQEQKLVSGSPTFQTFFGFSVDLSGDRAIVGNGNGADDVLGGAYVFAFDGAAWQLEGALGSGESERSVAVDGDVALVGEPGDSTNGLRTGRTLVYARRAGVWELEVERLGPDPLGQSGAAVAIEGERLAITANQVRFGSVPAGAADILTLRPYQTASVATRNGGANPFSYSAQPAAIGETLELTVFPGSTGHTHALVIGFDSPIQLLLAGGQTLLCLDLGGGGELINTGFMPGPIAHFELAVPDDLSLSGSQVCTQAIHAFGAVPFALSNAQDLVIGGCL